MAYLLIITMSYTKKPLDPASLEQDFSMHDALFLTFKAQCQIMIT